MQANYVQRMRLTFSKVGPTKYIGHLDLARTLERALNRAGVPVAYSQGFNRRPRMQFAAALPLGFTSEAELADIWLLEKMEPAQLREQLMARMAPGIIIHQVEEVSLNAPSLQNSTAAAEYRVMLEPEVAPEDLPARVADLLAQTTIMRERRDKAYDLRPLVQRLELSEPAGGSQVLWMRLALEAGATGRPDEVLAELGIEPYDVEIHRTAIDLIEPKAEKKESPT